MSVLAMLAGAANAVSSFASEPVPRTLTGCVSNGRFVTTDGYVIEPRYADGRELDMTGFEGRKIRIGGDLLPGDRLIVRQRPRDLGRCDPR